MSIECLEKFGAAIAKPKRVKILVGGRASTKTTFAADYVLSRLRMGKIWCCAREFQNSIEESVHRTLVDEAERCKWHPEFKEVNRQMRHIRTGGYAFYKGLERNVTSIKGVLQGLDGIWIEEGETLSEESLRVLTASLRLTALQAEKYLQGKATLEELGMPEIWITMNRRSREDAVAKKYLARAEPSLERCGYYEDDTIMVIQANYNDLPEKWWLASGLESERLDDYNTLSRAEYNHKWRGHYLEEVDNSIIPPEHFDACIDAYTRLGIKEPTGAKIMALDPSDTGRDSTGYAIRHGGHFYKFGEFNGENGNVDAADGLRLARQEKVDLFVWDGDGIGALLRDNVDRELDGINCETRMYRGSETPDNPDRVYSGTWSEGAKTNKQMFANKRAQYYTKLAERMWLTYRAVEMGDYIDPDDILSIDSSMPLLDKLRSEVCRIPKKHNNAGKIQLMSKDEMWRKHKIVSPNMADALAMAMEVPKASLRNRRKTPVNFDSFWD
jgi:phage terminase large subunit